MSENLEKYQGFLTGVKIPSKRAMCVKKTRKILFLRFLNNSSKQRLSKNSKITTFITCQKLVKTMCVKKSRKLSILSIVKKTRQINRCQSTRIITNCQKNSSNRWMLKLFASFLTLTLKFSPFVGMINS